MTHFAQHADGAEVDPQTGGGVFAAPTDETRIPLVGHLEHTGWQPQSHPRICLSSSPTFAQGRVVVRNGGDLKHT